MTESGRGHSWAKHLYWLSFLAALGVTVGLGWLGAPSLLAPFAAIAVMLGYVMISWVWTRDATRHPDFADGLYYMGFLLTLVALVNTLVRIGSTQGAEGEDVQQFVHDDRRAPWEDGSQDVLRP
jgi:Flp pilus assembly protein TadB